MFTKSSRRILCFFLTILMVVGICLFLGTTIVRATLCSPVYMEKFLSSSKITTYNDDAFKQKISLLSENSGIPVRVFEASDNVGGYSETVVERFYNGNDTTMLTKNKITVYENLIIEFLEGNNESYDSAFVHNTAIKAAEIYAECYGVKNTEFFKEFIDNTVSSYGKLVSLGLVIVLISFLLILSLFDNKKKSYRYYLSAFTAAGLSFVFTGAICLILGIGKGAVITPSVYSDAIFKSINVMFLIHIAVGLVVVVFSTIAALKSNKLIKHHSKF